MQLRFTSDAQADPEPHRRRHPSLWGAVAAQGIVDVLLVSSQGSGFMAVLHGATGLLTVLVCPGYLATSWIPQERYRLTEPGRWFIAVLLSMTVTVILGLVYAYGHVPLTARWVVLGLAAVVTGEVVITAWRSRQTLKPAVKRRRPPAVPAIGLVGVLIAIALVTSVIAASTLKPHTALYLTDARGHLEGYPYAIPWGTRAWVEVHVVLAGSSGYRLEEFINGRRVWTVLLHLRRQTPWTHRLRLPTTRATARVHLTLRLSPVTSRSPTREVYIAYWSGTSPP